MKKEEPHWPMRRSERILQLYEKQKRKLETFSPRKGNGTCHKIMQYNQKIELKSKIVMKRDRKETFDGARQNVNHSYGTRLQAKRKCEFQFFHEENDRFGKKTTMLEFSSEENGRQKKKRKHFITYDKDIGIMHGDKSETDLKKIKRKRKSCEFLNKVDVQLKVKRNCRNNNQVGNLNKLQVSYNMKEKHSSTPSNDKKVFKENENLAKTSIFGHKSAIESVQRMHMAFGKNQNIVTRNEFHNCNGSYNFLELTCNQEDIDNNKQISQQNYKPHFTYNHSCIERTYINMNETFLIIQRMDDMDITNISLCKEPFAGIDTDHSQDHSCLYPTIKDLKIQVGHYEDNDYPSLANSTTTGSYMESINTSTSVTHTNVTVKQEPMWDDYEKETECTEDNESDSGDTDLPVSTLSKLGIRPIKRRKRVLVPLRIRLLKNQTMRKAWKENTTCCLKYCWIDWPTVTVGQI